MPLSNPKEHVMSNLRTLARRALPILLTLGAAVSALPAQAGGVQWSVGINLPMPGVVVYPAPPHVAYAPAPVYVQPPRRVYMQEPQVVYVQPREHRHWHHRRHEWRENYREDYRDGNRGDDRQDWRHGR